MKRVKAPRPRPKAQDELSDVVRRIVSDVRLRRDAALREHTQRWDHIDRPSPVIGAAEVEAALAGLPDEVRQVLEWARDRIAAFAGAQRDALRAVDIELGPGVRVGHRLLPIQAVGCYVPGGQYALPSSALMTIVPARVAGVPRIAACSPPGPGGSIDPITLAAMALAGAHEIYCMGGAQAIAALAYGTQSVRAVDDIVGPGNRYVVEAKRQVCGTVGIDLLAGPTEVCVIADGAANPVSLAADLLAQAEHDVEAKAVLLTVDEELARVVLTHVEDQLGHLPRATIARMAWEGHGEVIVVERLEEACAQANALAPEHLQLHVADPDTLIPLLTAYGSLFIGVPSGTVFGDYAAGPTHVLPTGGTARFTAGLWVGHFLRVAPFVRLSSEGAAALAPMVIRLAELEGLPGHYEAARLRLARTPPGGCAGPARGGR
ncbi:MAG: histidinol dehydrogenase [Armatimonadetes bacterium]|nr:histidinol dehydrogenase [Armatimonadota bacterium]